jgi:two-component system response regulator MprA
MTFDPHSQGRSAGADEGQSPVPSTVMPTETASSPTHVVTRPSRLLVVDDDENVTNMLRRALSFEGYAVAIARDGEAALKQTLEFAPDLVVLDIMMPGIDGVEVARRLRAGDPHLAILMLTAKDAAADEVVGLDAGADDYLVKPFTLEVLTARIRALLRRKEPVEVEVLRFADLALDTGTRSARRGSREIALTTTEYELLLQFLRHPRQVLEKEHLTEKVWGYDFGGNYNVLEVYVRYLRQKLEAGGEPRLIHTLRGAGYVLREPAA